MSLFDGDDAMRFDAVFTQKQGVFRFDSYYVSIACHVTDMNESHLKKINTKKKCSRVLSVAFICKLFIISN